MAPLLFLRRILVLHAAAVRYDDRVVAIAGTSGVGKSTALFGCLRRGGGFITDDIAALHFGDSGHTIRVHAGAPGVRLWPDALTHYTVAPEGTEPLRPALDKRVVRVQTGAAEALPLTTLVILESRPHAMQCRRVAGREAFNAVRSQLHGPRMVNVIDRVTAFRQVATLAQHVPTFVLQRPDDLSAVDRVVDTILALSP